MSALKAVAVAAYWLRSAEWPKECVCEHTYQPKTMNFKNQAQFMSFKLTNIKPHDLA